MGNWTKVVVILIILSIGVAFAGYMGYRSKYVEPRAEIEKKRAEIQQQIDNGKTTSENWSTATARLRPLYTRSFPLKREAAALQYQLWLAQMLDFCNVNEPKVTVRDYVNPRGSSLATQRFQVQGEFTLLDLTQFLYEFYWTPFLHRIALLDIQPQEHSDRLNVTMTIEGLTISKLGVNQPYPLDDKLPLSTNPPKQLSSGPFAAYKQIGEMDIFRVVRSGVDAASFAKLTGTPVVTDEGGSPTKFARWYLGTEGRTQSYKIGDTMKVGAFEAEVIDIDSDGGLVVLKQKTGNVWAVPLGYCLSEAVAVPANLF